MTVQVIHEKCELGKAEDKKLPSDSFLVSYKIEDELKHDITRAGSQMELFDHYYDTYKNVQQISWTKGIVNPKTYDNVSNKSSPPKKRKKKV
mgnify:FL=1|tara:strand:- start:182 stop:457 length:276 start_codon:yes stop_codon:yes gene_type:complete